VVLEKLKLKPFMRKMISEIVVTIKAKALFLQEGNYLA